MNGEVAVVGNTVIVGAGILPGGGTRSGFYNGTTTNPCPGTSVKVVDISTPTAPAVRSTIPVPAGVVAHDVAALHVTTPSFTGDLAAVALVQCPTNPAGNLIDRGVGYYNVTDPTNPQFLGRYHADANLETPTDPACGTPTSTGSRCASSIHQVSLVQRASDGKVLSLATEPGASGSQAFVPNYSGDMRVVDVTNPTAPTEVGSYPNALPAPDERPPGFNGSRTQSNNGCRPFQSYGYGANFYPDGSKALLADFDAGLLTAGLTNPADPNTLGLLPFPTDRATEGNAAYVDFATAGGRSLALEGDSDWIAPSSTLRIDTPGALAGSKFACEAMWTLFDPEDTAQVYRHPSSQVPGGIVYVGRGCPGDPYPTGVTAASLAGKIAFRDRNRITSRQGPGGASCSGAAASKRLQDDGAAGVVVANTSTTAPQAIAFDGDPTGQTIPTSMIDTGDANALRDAVCPAPASAPTTFVVTCAAGGVTASGAMVDSPGAWGGLRVVDVTDPGAPSLRGTYQPPTSQAFPPPDIGSYSVHHAVASGSTAFVAGHANGVRAIDLTSANPSEVASFVPADTADPTNQSPAKANVTGVAVASNGLVVASDTNSGLYVLAFTGPQPPGGGGGGGGSVITPGVSPGLTRTPDLFAPGVSGFGLTNNPFAVGGSTPIFGTAAAKKHKKGTTFRYTLSEAATVKIAMSQRLAGRRRGKRCVAPTRSLRKAKRCTRVVSRGTLTRNSHVGVNSVAFSGRIGSKKLSPGSYLATLTATDAAKNSSAPKTISFTIVTR